MKNISLLGATGSIGTSVLEVVRQFKNDYKIVSMAAGRNVELFAEQINEFQPEVVSVLNSDYAQALLEKISNKNITILTGAEGNQEVATHKQSKLCLSAIVGAAGLIPTLAAIDAGKDIGLANKETLVMAGKIVMEQVDKKGVALLPVDSEHSAIFQGMHAGDRSDLSKIVLTASGGPFHGRSTEELKTVTKAQALAHPNWEMGEKISIDSATLMNKGLEVIEAKWLFNLSPDQIEVVVHPQSIVHSLVEYKDGSMIGHLGIADMCIPIAYAMSFPRRLPLKLDKLNLAECARLDFVSPDYDNFPALGLAFEALELGGVAPAVLNAANEVAVASFLAEEISYLDIAKVAKFALGEVREGDDSILSDILSADALAREKSSEFISELNN